MVVYLADVAVVEGSHVTLPCTAEGYPTPHVAWIAPNGTVLQNRTTDTNLTFIDITRHSNGTYECVASNYLEPPSVKVNLVVLCKYLISHFCATKTFIISAFGKLSKQSASNRSKQPSFHGILRGFCFCLFVCFPSCVCVCVCVCVFLCLPFTGGGVGRGS